MDIDESQYGEFALKVLDEGKPYVSSVGEKPPLLYFFYVFVFWIFGKNQYWAVHLATLFWVFLTVYGFYRIGRDCFFRGFSPAFSPSSFVSATFSSLFPSFGGYIGFLAGLFYSIFSTTHEPKLISTNGETLMNGFLVWSVYAFLRFDQLRNGEHRVNTTKWFWLVLSGILTGLAFLCRHQAGFHLPVLLLYLFLLSYPSFLSGSFWFFWRGNQRENQRKNRKKSSVFRVFRIFLGESGWLIFCFLIPFGVASWIFYSMGVFEEFFFWNFIFNFRYVTAGYQLFSLEQASLRVLLFVLFTMPLWYGLFFGAWEWTKELLKQSAEQWTERWKKQWDKEWSKERKLLLEPKESLRNHSERKTEEFRWKLFLFLWIFFSVLPVGLGGRFYSHYFLQILPALCFFSAWAIVSRGLLSRRMVIVLVLYALLFWIPRLDWNLTHGIVRNIDPKSARIGVYPEQREVGEYIQKHSQKKDFIFVWGFATPIYVYADRRAGSRFSWSDFLSGRVPGLPPWEDWKEILKQLDADTTLEPDFYVLEKAWIEFCQDLFHYQPLYFVDTSPGDYHEYGAYSLSRSYKGYSPQKIIQPYYKLEKQIKGIYLYRRKKKIRQNPCS